MLVRAAGRQWSVPRRCIGRRVTVVAMPGGQVRVRMGGEEVAVARRRGGRRPRSSTGRSTTWRRSTASAGRTATYARPPAPTWTFSTRSEGAVASERRRRGEPLDQGRGTTLSALGLHEMAASLPDYVRMVSAGERDFCSALEEMTRVEVAAREARIVRQRIRSSGFPYVKGARRLRLGLPAERPEGPHRGARDAQVHRARRERAARRQPGRGQDPPRRGHRHRGRAGGARGEVHGLRQARRGPPGRAGPRDPQEAPQVLRALEAARHRRARVPRHRRGRGRPALSNSSRRATSSARRSSPPTSASAAGGRCSGTTWRRARSRTASATTATSSRSRADPTG